jgi:DsbC/DsbD-like thiol-disulfide interchange protein
MVILGNNPYFRCMIWWMTTSLRTLLCAALALWSVLTPASASAQAVVSTGESFVDVSFLPGRAEADGTRIAGLVLDVAPDWKTYWRHPGVAGIPPSFNWSGSRNLEAAEIMWPRPSFFDSFGLTTLGYSGKVVFPVRLVPKDPGQPMEIDLVLSLGVCRDICVLEETRAQVRIAPGDPDAGGTVIAAAEGQVPRPGVELGLGQATCRISGAGKKRRFDAELDFARSLEDPVVILEGPDLTWFTDVETTDQAAGGPDGSRLQVGAALSLLDSSVWINRSQVRMTVLAGDFAADIQGCTAPG